MITRDASRKNGHPSSIYALALVAAVGVLCSCSPAPVARQSDGLAAQTQTALAPTPPALARIDRMIQRELRRPVASARAAGSPPSLDASAFELIAPDDSIARLTLEDAATKFPYTPPSDDTPGAEAAEDTTRRSPALRAYLQGKRALRDGNTTAAIDRFRTATRLTPNAVEPWSALGDAYTQSGNRIAASGAYKRVIALDPANVGALDVLSRQAIELGRAEEALPLLFKLLDANLAARDAALPFIVRDRLGRALGDLGYTRAASEAFDGAIDLPERFTSPTASSREIGALYRVRGERRLRIGDAFLRLGEPERALEQYVAAANLPGTNTTDALARRLFAHARMGHPASAGKALIESLLTGRASVSGEMPGLIEYTATLLDDRAILGNALAQAPAILAADRVAQLKPTLLRASALAMGPEGAAEFLLGQLETDPSSRDSLALLLDLFDSTTPADKGELLRRLVERSPVTAGRTTLAAAWAWADLDDIAGALKPSGNTGTDDLSRLSRGLLLANRDNPESAVESWAGASYDTPSGQLAHAHRAVMLVLLERRDQAELALEPLKESVNPAALLQAARAWASLERPKLAADALDRATSQGTPPPAVAADALIVQSDLALASRDNRLAYDLTRRAIELTPNDSDLLDRALSIAATLDGDESTDEIESLITRDAPSSPVATVVRARELLAQDRANTAFRMLREAADSTAPNSGIDRLYYAMMNANRVHDEALAWLKKRREVLPADSQYARWEATTLTGLGRNEDAAKLLEAWLNRYPGEDTTRLLLSGIYRNQLEQPERADALILDMLQLRPPTPERSILKLQISQNRSDLAGMTSALSELDGIFGTLDDSQRTIVHRSAQRLTLAADRSAELRGQVAEFMRLLARIDAAMPPQFVGSLAILSMDRGAGARDAADLIAGAGDDVDARNAALNGYVLHIDQREDVTAEHLRVFPLVVEREGATVLAQYEAWLIGVRVAMRSFDGNDPAPGRSITEAVEGVGDRDALREVLNGVAGRLSTNGRSEPLFADLSYLYALMLDRSNARDETVDTVYRLILEAEPNHADANNNLGYRLLERGDDLQEAFALIERAYKQEPDAIHILDSYGWALHKLGRNEDSEEGDGAITVLEQALHYTRESMRLFQRNAAGRVNTVQKNEMLLRAFLDEATLVTILSHIGDACWAAGRREDAVKHWNNAVLLVDSFGIRNDTFEVPDNVIEQYRKDAETSRGKVRAASEDRDPLATGEDPS